MLKPKVWFGLMIKKIKTIRVKRVYKLVKQLVGRNVISSKWVFAFQNLIRWAYCYNSKV